MQIIEGFRVRNYRVLRDVMIGAIHPSPPQTDGDAGLPTNTPEPLTALTVVIGKNGFGKSTLFDAFGFLVDSLKFGVEQACSLRGGFSKIVSQNSDGRLQFDVRYGDLLYSLLVAADEYGVPFVFSETLSHVSPDPENQDSMNFYVQNGKGKVIRLKSQTVGDVQLANNRGLALATLGNLSEYQDIVSFKVFLDGWYLCYFKPDAARGLPAAGPQKHLSTRGENLANVVQYMEREHKDKFRDIIDRVAARIPGISMISTKTTEDGRLLLCFNNQGFTDPFYASQISDGTLRLFAYMLLLADPEPAPFICFEEPENGLYHKLLQSFIEEIRIHSERKEVESGTKSQFFITTHQPYLVDALSPREVWVLEKGEDGFASIRRASDDPVVKSMVEGGLPLGALWYSEYLDGE